MIINDNSLDVQVQYEQIIEQLAEQNQIEIF